MKTSNRLSGKLALGILAIGVSAVALTACDDAMESSASAAQTAGETADAETAERNFPPKPQLPTMELQAQYQGPFEDTIIQRWRDPIDGRICYVYIPAQVDRERRDDSPFLDYGNNAIGSISCGTAIQIIDPRAVQPGNTPRPNAQPNAQPNGQ